MKRCILLVFVVLCTLSLFAENVWENPVLIRQAQDTKYLSTSVAMPNGIVTVWSDTRDGNCQLYAQYQNETGTKLWNEQGLKLENNPSIKGEHKVYKADDNSVLVVWEEHQFDTQTYIKKAQKINLNGDLLWGESGITYYTNSNDIIFYDNFSDNAGGFYFVNKQEQNYNLYHINSEGVVSNPTNLQLPPNSKINDYDFNVLFSNQSGITLTYILNNNHFLANFSTSGNQNWSVNTHFNTLIQSSEFDIQYSQNSNYLIICRNYENTSIQAVSATGNLMWGEQPILLSSKYSLNFPKVAELNNKSYFLLCNVSDYRIVGIDSLGNNILDYILPMNGASYSRSYGNTLIAQNNALYAFYNEEMTNGYTNILVNKFDENGSVFWQNPLTINMPVDAIRNFNVCKQNNNLMVFWMNYNNSIYSQGLNVNDQFIIPNNPCIIHQALCYSNYYSYYTPKTIQKDGKTLIVWIDDISYQTSGLFYQIVNSDGQKLFESSRRLLPFENIIYNDYLLQLDNNGNVIIVCNVVESRSPKTILQKIDWEGNLLYTPAGIKVFDTVSSIRKEFQLFNDGSDLFIYGSTYDISNFYGTIIGQKITNGNIMWGPYGKVIIDKADGGQFDENNIDVTLCNLSLNENTIFWHEYQNGCSSYRILKLDSEGLPAPGWNTEGNLIVSLPYDLSSNQHNNLISLANGYLFTYDSGNPDLNILNYYYQIISNNGELLLSEPALLKLPNIARIINAFYNGTLTIIYELNTSNEQSTNYAVQKFNIIDNHLVAAWTEPKLLSSTSSYPIIFEMLFNRIAEVSISDLDLNFKMYNENGELMGVPSLIYINQSKVINDFTMQKTNNSELICLWSSIILDGEYSSGQSIYLQKISSSDFTETDVPENSTNKIELYQNYPNPFNPSTCISFNLKNTQNVEVNIYNIKGQKVKELVNTKLEAGKHSFTWDGNNQNNKKTSAGIYFYQIKAGDFKQTKKMIMIK